MNNIYEVNDITFDLNKLEVVSDLKGNYFDFQVNGFKYTTPAYDSPESADAVRFQLIQDWESFKGENHE